MVPRSSSDRRIAGGAERAGFSVDEPAVTTSAESAASDVDVLLATKLHVPRSHLGLVPRPRLAELLDEGLGPDGIAAGGSAIGADVGRASVIGEQGQLQAGRPFEPGVQ
jgi:hypothetical protein